MILSFIIPVYNGEHTIQPLFVAVKKACNEYNYEFEVVFIWDNGPDKSWEKILELKKQFPSEVKAIRLTRNFGQHNAIICGFANAKGDYMITMDEDLQHNPQEVNLLVEKQKEQDYDVVYGNYLTLQHNWFRNLTSRMVKKLLEVGIPDLHKDYSAYRIIRRDIALATTEMQNSYTFLDGYLAWITTNVGSVQVSHNIRQGGISSYSMKKLINHSINIIMTFTNIPVKLVTYLSLFFFIFTFGYAIYILIEKLIFNNLLSGFASGVIIVGFGIGSILFGISVIGEYIRSINQKTTGKPNYKVHTIL
jgi:polyisoprenyl-phosphate glycosyltransferase